MPAATWRLLGTAQRRWPLSKLPGARPIRVATGSTFRRLRLATRLRAVLVLLNFDSASVPLLERMMSDGRLPTVAGLFARGRRFPLETPAVDFPAASYPVLYSGLDLPKHGLYYTFLWSPDEQRVRYIAPYETPP